MPHTYYIYTPPPPPHTQGTVSAKGTSMASQTDINERFRGILVDWLVEVHLKFRMNPETLYLTVSIIDRFLERKSITRGNLQLVGIAGMHCLGEPSPLLPLCHHHRCVSSLPRRVD